MTNHLSQSERSADPDRLITACIKRERWTVVVDVLAGSTTEEVRRALEQGSPVLAQVVAIHFQEVNP